MAFKRSSVRSRLSPPENANGFAVRVFRWIDTKAISDPKGRIPSICDSKYLPVKTNSDIKLKWNYLLRLHKTVYQP